VALGLPELELELLLELVVVEPLLLPGPPEVMAAVMLVVTSDGCEVEPGLSPTLRMGMLALGRSRRSSSCTSKLVRRTGGRLAVRGLERFDQGSFFDMAISPFRLLGRDWRPTRDTLK
jgi:hypothetical protein